MKTKTNQGVEVAKAELENELRLAKRFPERGVSESTRLYEVYMNLLLGGE